jgi:hypothetical protein
MTAEAQREGGGVRNTPSENGKCGVYSRRRAADCRAAFKARYRHSALHDSCDRRVESSFVCDVKIFRVNNVIQALLGPVAIERRF